MFVLVVIVYCSCGIWCL